MQHDGVRGERPSKLFGQRVGTAADCHIVALALRPGHVDHVRIGDQRRAQGVMLLAGQAMRSRTIPSTESRDLRHSGRNEIHLAREPRRRALQHRGEIGERMHRPPLEQVADEGKAEVAPPRELLGDCEQVEQRLGRVLAVAVACIDHRHVAHCRRARRRALLLVAQHDHVAIAALDADRVLERFALDGGGKLGRVLGGDHRAAEPGHRRLEGMPRSGRGLVEQRDHHMVAQRVPMRRPAHPRATAAARHAGAWKRRRIGKRNRESPV